LRKYVRADAKPADAEGWKEDFCRQNMSEKSKENVTIAQQPKRINRLWTKKK
jgi:hypothetical protein